MKRIAIVVVPLEGYSGHLVFDDMITVLLSGLRSLGHEVIVTHELYPVGYTPIVLNMPVAGAVGAPKQALPVPWGAVMYNLEPPDSSWIRNMGPVMAAAVRNRKARLWEMRQENIRVWRDRYEVEATWMPMAYAPELAQVVHQEHQDIDVLFSGSVSERRKETLLELYKLGLRVKHHSISEHDSRLGYMGRAKVVLSLRFDVGYQVETIRLVHALANRSLVVCESGEGIEPFNGGLISCSYADLPRTVEEWVRHKGQAERLEVADRGCELVRAMPAAQHLARAIAESGL